MARGQKRKYSSLTRMSQIHVDGLIPQIAANWGQPSILDCIPAGIRYRIHDDNGKATDEPENNPQNWGIQFLKELFDLSDHTKERFEEVRQELVAAFRKRREEGIGGDTPWLRDWDVIEVHRRFCKEAEMKAEEEGRVDEKDEDRTLVQEFGMETAGAEKETDTDLILLNPSQAQTDGRPRGLYSDYQRRPLPKPGTKPDRTDEKDVLTDNEDSPDTSEESSKTESESESEEDWDAPAKPLSKRLRLEDTHGAPLSLSPDQESRYRKISDFFTVAPRAMTTSQLPASSLPPAPMLNQRVTRSMRASSQMQSAITTPETPPPAYDPLPRSAHPAHTDLLNFSHPPTPSAFTQTKPNPPRPQPFHVPRPMIHPIHPAPRRPIFRPKAPLAQPPNGLPSLPPLSQFIKQEPLPGPQAPSYPRLQPLLPPFRLGIKPDPDTQLPPLPHGSQLPRTNPSLLRLEYEAAAAASRAAQLRLEMARQGRSPSPAAFVPRKGGTCGSSLDDPLELDSDSD
ncbi:hypothetical protein BU16DRAFT_618631 [Lophium mytilinum]|uniref:Uncharacterized protein n=1 Tax=Lophium mytilinum TaxID=390894 RepID=A0A6A6QS25_9PEZI|nr:hypothetical protein BU16DRAFT_618631 [Lophium mytilinum]